MIKLFSVIPDLYLSKSIIILGSDKSLLNNNGSYINSFDEVVRFNRAPTDGYEEYVGNKTTLRVANNAIMKNIQLGNGWSEIGEPTFFIKNLNNSRILTYEIPEDEEHHRENNNKIFVIDYYKFYDVLKNDYGLNMPPSCGVLFVLLCVKSGIVPTITGFDLEHNKERGHYWEKVVDDLPHEKCHNENNEKNILMELKGTGKIIII